MMDLLNKSAEIIDPIKCRFYKNVGKKALIIEIISEENLKPAGLLHPLALLILTG